MSTEDLLTPAEVASLLNTSKTSVFRLADAGDLSPLRISPKIIRFRRADVDALLARSAS
jgi:excisionase family DNA binding protein